MKLKPYPQYKPSRVDWLGSVPGHWAVARLKYLVTVNDDQLPETMEPSFEMAYIDIGSVDTDRGITAPRRVRFEDAPSRARRVLKPGDTIVSTVRTYLRATATFHDDLEENTIASTGFAVLRPNNGMSPRYLGYIAGSSPFIESVCGRSVGVSYPAVNASDIRTILVAHPCWQEQEVIAAFLDHQTAKIDALIDKTEILIERLDEKRRALINETVIRGLPPDENRKAGLDPVPKLKPSGVKWLGDVPEHWKIQRSDRVVRYLALETVSPSVLRAEPVVHYSVPSVQDRGAGMVQDGDTILSNKQLITDRVLLISRLNPRKSTICYAKPDDHLTTVASIEFVALLPVLVDSGYFYYVVLSELTRQRLDSNVRSVTRSHQRTTPRSVRQFWHAWPPHDEQQVIATFLAQKTVKIDTLINKSQALIDRLREKRQALITAAVTGQIDVRGAQEGETT